MMPEAPTMKKNSETTFAVEILSRHNFEWQGSITWIKGHKTRHFRSVLELLKLMNSTSEFLYEKSL